MKRKKTLRVISVIVIFIIILILSFYRDEIIKLGSRWDVEKLQEVVEGFGAWGLLAFIGIASLKPFLFFPNAFIFIVGGLVYGTALGSIASIIGVMTAFSLCYWLGARFHHAFMRFVGRKHVIRLQNLKDEEIIRVLFTMRVTPGFPIDAISYGAGLAGISYNKFFVGSLLGIAPKIVLYTFLGDNINDIFSVQAIMVYILLLLLAIIPTWMHKKKNKTEG